MRTYTTSELSVFVDERIFNAIVFSGFILPTIADLGRTLLRRLNTSYGYIFKSMKHIAETTK